MALTSFALAGPAHAQLPVEVIHSFAGQTTPAWPRGTLIDGGDGYVYGTSTGGGTFHQGSVFRVTPSGEVTVLHSFAGGDGGAEPYSGVIRGTDGNFYGTTAFGGRCATGTGGCGTVFKMAPNGAVTILHALNGGSDGRGTYQGLVQANDGNLYGVASYAGAHGGGTVFRVTPAGGFTVLHAFAGPQASFDIPPRPADTDGASPEARLIQGVDGNLYGTTAEGGAYSWGAAFRMTLDGQITILHAFSNRDGSLPRSALLEASDGNFYGTASGEFVGAVVVYRMTPAGAITGVWKTPYWTSLLDAPFIQASDGNLYGVAYGGHGEGDFGAIFRMTLAGTFTTIHTFRFADGDNPTGAVLQGGDGRLYGTTVRGGAGALNGTIFSTTLDGSFTSLVSFTAGPEGSFPYGGVVQAADGSLYGTTGSGGTFGQGTVYRTSTGGAMTVLRSFTRTEGRPGDRLLQGRDGNFYGVSGDGTLGRIYRVTPTGDVSTVHSFTGGADGGYANPLMLGADGNFYGTTRFSNGSVNRGTVFRLTPSGTLTTIYTFSGGADGGTPGAALTQGADGSFYGTTYNGGAAKKGTVFRMTPAGAISVLHTFDGLVWKYGSYDEIIGSTGHPEDGAEPLAALIQASDGALYGTTRQGGAYGYGTLFRISADGRFSLVHSFGSRGDAMSPSSPLLQANDGFFYGTTYGGGATGNGTIYRAGLDGSFVLLHSFTGDADGAGPSALIQGRDGYLYGTTASGRTSFGQVFRFLPLLSFTPRILFTASSPGGLALTWSSVPGSTRYAVVRRGGGGESIVAAGLTATTFTDRTAEAGVVYSYRVVATDAAGNSVDSPAVSVPWLTPVSRTPTITMVGDHDGDGRADLTVYRRSTGEWFTHRSSDGELSNLTWGSPLLQDRPVPADYDGDGLTDIAVYRQTTGDWLIRRSSDSVVTELTWGSPALDDLPVPADYDGDGRADLAVYRATSGEWLIHRSTDSALQQWTWGSPANGDVPVPADYDADGRTDLAVYRATTGEWFIRLATGVPTGPQLWGSPANGDVPVPADYDGDGRSDMAVFRASTGEWLIRRSSAHGLIRFVWGAALLGDVPAVGDYDGDGRADAAVYRESTGEWFIVGSSSGAVSEHWGSPTLGDTVRAY